MTRPPVRSVALYWLPVFAYVGAIFALSTIRGGGTRRLIEGPGATETEVWTHDLR